MVGSQFKKLGEKMKKKMVLTFFLFQGDVSSTTPLKKKTKMMPLPRALSHHHPARASGQGTVSASTRFSKLRSGVSTSGRSARTSASLSSSSSSSSSPSTRKALAAAAAMPFFFGRPSLFSRRGAGAGRGDHLPARATAEEHDGAPPSTLYADLEVISPGLASPLGPSKVSADGGGGKGNGGGQGSGVNFALWSSAATSVTLCLLDPRSRRPAREVPLARTEADRNVWAATVLGLPLKGVGYAFKVDGPPPPSGQTRNRWSPRTLLLDPYAPLVDSRSRFGVRDAREAFVPLVGSSFVGTFDFESPEFDWGERELFFFHVFFSRSTQRPPHRSS